MSFLLVLAHGSVGASQLTKPARGLHRQRRRSHACHVMCAMQACQHVMCGGWPPRLPSSPPVLTAFAMSLRHVWAYEYCVPCKLAPRVGI